MNKYTIYCTTEQTRKALELGAQINTFGYGDLGDAEDKILKLNKQCVIERDDENSIIVSFLPTAEQMIGWLEEQDIFISINHIGAGYSSWLKTISTNENISENLGYVSTRKEATLAAIDAALEYLTDNKK